MNVISYGAKREAGGLEQDEGWACPERRVSSGCSRNGVYGKDLPIGREAGASRPRKSWLLSASHHGRINRGEHRGETGSWICIDDPEKQKRIASRVGKAAHAKGRAHEGSEEEREAGT